MLDGEEYVIPSGPCCRREGTVGGILQDGFVTGLRSMGAISARRMALREPGYATPQSLVEIQPILESVGAALQSLLMP